MNSIPRTALLVCALVATGLLAGFFYAYTASVNQGLGQLDDRSYIAAMQSINDAVPNPIFVLSFIGALLTGLATLVHLRAGNSAKALLVGATLLVVSGGLLVTFFASVPLNDQLAGIDLNAGPAALGDARGDYESAWNTWNTIRTLTCTSALACLGLALGSTVGPTTRPAPSSFSDGAR